METMLLLAWLAAVGGFAASATWPGPGAARTIEHEDVAIRQALSVLGQGIDPIETVGFDHAARLYARIPGAPPPVRGMVAFRLPGDRNAPRIFVNRDSDVYRKASARPRALALLKLAAVLVHEQVHATDGEHAAYRLQADFIRSRLQRLSWRDRAAGEGHRMELEGRATTFRRVEELGRQARRGQSSHVNSRPRTARDKDTSE